VVNPIISIVIQDEVFLCIYDSCITLTATNTSQVAWSEADGTFLSNDLAIEVCPDASTTYIAETQDVGCYLPDSVTVSIVLVPEITARPDTSVCPGEPVRLYASGGATYVWTTSDGALIDGMAPTVSSHSTQTYTVLGESSQGCIASDEVTVTILPMPVASFSISAPDGYLSLLPINFTSTSANAACWLWSFDDVQYSGNVGPNASHTFSAPGDYNVELMVCNDYGCWDSTYQIIRLTSEFYFYVPNTFTPDDDDLNAVFKVVGTNIAQENFQMIILNRWGEVIYEMNSPDDVWMGNHRSNNEYFVEDGVYI
jgi:gliding motility-associated-like protein